MKCGVVKSLCKCISQLIGFCDEEIKKWHKSSRSAKGPLLSVLFGCFALILFIALFDYESSNFHSSPSEGSTPLLGRIGVIGARYFL